MLSFGSFSFETIRAEIYNEFMVGQPQRVDVGEWQSIDVKGKPEMVSHELAHVVVDYTSLPQTRSGLQASIPCNHTWAEAHFQERVSGEPLNPPPSHEIWPYAQEGNGQFRETGKFSHTYPERFWPKYAGRMMDIGPTNQLAGIRFKYGDLDDVLDQLTRNLYTRQAYLPIWFPEDTGANQGQRVPCTLGYHFLIRDSKLTVTYFMRSCDFRRHFADDVYLAARLAQFVAGNLCDALEDAQGSKVIADRLIMHIVSLHVFQGDMELMRKERSQWKQDAFALNYGTGLPNDIKPARRIEDYQW